MKRNEQFPRIFTFSLHVWQYSYIMWNSKSTERIQSFIEVKSDEKNQYSKKPADVPSNLNCLSWKL